MTTGLLVGCATAMILVFAGNNDAAVMKGTLSWQIEVTAFFSYKSTADRDSMLQQILDVWKTNFDDKYQLYDEKITVVTELPGPEAFEQYKQLTFRISGKGPTGFNLKPLVSSFNTAITAAAIPGVELYLTSGSNTEGSTRFNVDVQANFVYSSSGARDRLLQQILALFKTQFASYSFTNLKITVQSEQPSDVEGAKLLTFRISGQSSGDIDIKTLNTKFMAAIKTSKITGITLPESSGDTDEATTASTGTDEGATPSSDTDEGSSATGGNKFTVTFNVVAKYNTQTELDAILQQILKIFKQKYGSLYGATQIIIKVPGNKPNPSGGFSLTIVITGSSKTPINVTKVTKEFVTVVSSSKITGVQIVTGSSVTGGGSGTSEEGGETEEGTTPKADTEEGTTPSSETEGGSTPKSGTEEGTTPASGTEEGTTPASGTEEGTTPASGTEEGTTPKTGTEEGTTPASGTEEGTTPNSGTEDTTTPQAGTEEGTTPKTDTDEATTPKSDNEGGTTPQSKPDDGTSDSGNTFTLEYTVTLRFVTPVQRDRLLQQILQLWIKTYGAKYGVVNPQITVTGSPKPSTSVTGSFVVTYTITGTSSTPVPDTVKEDFNKILMNAKINGVLVDEDTTQGDNSVEGNRGDGSNGDQEVTNTGRDLCSTVSVNQINGRTITRGTFSTNFTVYLTYKTASVRNDILQKLLAIWGDTLDQATKLKMCFYTEQLSIGKLEGGLVVNKVTYGISGTATVNFNTAAVAKVFEQAVADSSLQNVFFTTDFGDCSTKAVPDTNQFTVTVSVVIKYKSQTELDTILQQILKLWIQKYGSIYGATRVTIKVTGKKPNPSGGFSLTIVISGSSKTVIDVTKVTKEFITVISSSKITGVTITTGGSITGGGSGTSEEGGETEEGTTPKSETEEGTTPKSGSEEGTTPKSENSEGTTPSGDTDEGTTPKSDTGSTPQSDVDLDTTPKSGTEEGTTPKSETEEGTTPKADNEDGTTPQSKTEEGATPSGETEEGTPSTGGNKFTVTVNVIVKYSTQTELDAILQQLLKIWIKKYGSLYGATHVTIKVTGKKPNPSGGFSLTIVITGSSKTVINVTKVTKEFVTVISSSKITGVQIITGGSVTGGGSGTSEEGGETEEGTTPKSETEEGTTPKTETEEGTTPKTDSEEGTTPKSGTEEGTTPKGDNEEGTTPKSGSEEGTTPKAETEEGTTPQAGTDEGTTPQSKTEEGTTPSGETEEGTPSSGGSKFTVTVNVVIKYTTQTELDSILQQILKLWIKKYGSMYGATQVTIKVTGKKPNPAGGFSLTIVITGSSKTVIDVTKVTKEFITVISTSRITGVTISTGGSGTSEDGGETEEGTTPTADAGEGTTPKTETEDGTTPKSDTEEGTTPKSEGGEGTTPKGDAEEGTTPQSKSEEGTTPGSDSGEETTPASTETTGGNSFKVTVTIVVTYKTQTELDSILQQILKLWIQKYGTKYGATGVTIKVGVKKPNSSGGYIISIIISGSSKTVVDVQTVSKQFITVISTAKITGVQVPDNETSGDDNEVTTAATEGDDSKGSGKKFTFDYTVTITYKTETEYNNLLQKILTIWIKHFGTKYGISGGKTVITGTPTPTATKGKYTLHLTITGTYTTGTFDVDTVTSEFKVAITKNEIPGVTVSEEKEDGAATEAPEEGATPKADEGGATTASSKETSEGSDEAVTPTAVPGIDKSGTDHDMEDVFGHSITLHFTRYITYTTETQLKDILNQVYVLFMTAFGPAIQLTREQHSEIHVYGTPKPTSVKTTFQVEFVINFWAKTTLSTTEMETQFDSMLKEGHIKGISTDAPSESTDEGSSDDDSTHDFELDMTLFIKYKTDAELQKKLNEILKVWIAKFGTEYQVTEQKIQLVGKPSSTSVKGIFQVHFTIDGITTMFAKMTEKVVGKSRTPRFQEMLESSPIAGVYLELPSSASDDSGNESDDGEDTEDNDANKVTDTDNGGKFGVSENQRNGKTVGPGNFDVTLTVYLAYDTASIRDNFLQRLLVIWRNSLNDYQVTNLKVEFEKDALNVGKLPKEQGGAKVNKVWYRLTGSTVLAFNTAVVSKTFEQTVVDAHLGGVTFTLGAFGTKQA